MVHGHYVLALKAVDQQHLHGPAANARQLADASLERLRGCGFSARKVATLQGANNPSLVVDTPAGNAPAGPDSGNLEMVQLWVNLPAKDKLRRRRTDHRRHLASSV